MTAAVIVNWDGERQSRLGGSVLSVVLHLLLAALIVFYAPRHGHRAAGAPKNHAPVQISLDRSEPEITQAQPVPEPQVQQPPTPVPPAPMPRQPAPAPSVPKPPSPAKPKAAAKPQQQSSSASAADAPKKVQDEDPSKDTDEFLQGVRAHWLQPPATRRDFHCRIKVDYQAGGIISAVTVQEGCGGATLDDSVERAIWKTQPMPLPASSKNQGGSLMLDFTP